MRNHRDDFVPGQRPDWRAQPITPQERAAYARGLDAGMRRGWGAAAALYTLATVALILAAHALGVHP